MSTRGSGSGASLASLGFEADLLDCWQRRNYDDWLVCRAIYADWLEERNDPLYPMARAVCTMNPCHVRTKGGLRVWLWRLYFRIDRPAPAPRYARKRRMNAASLLGFPRATLRCMEVSDEEARFTVTFKERVSRRWVQREKGVLANAGEWVEAAWDTDLHPAGFARLFWPAAYPPEWDPPVPLARSEPSLFDALEEPCT